MVLPQNMSDYKRKVKYFNNLNTLVLIKFIQRFILGNIFWLFSLPQHLDFNAIYAIS